MNPREDGAPVLACAVTAAVPHPRMDAQRQEVGDEQADRGEDQAEDAPRYEPEGQDGGEDEREVVLLHTRTVTASGGQV